MIGEPQRRQYLDAMGLTSWASRYRLPNARPTPTCSWEETVEEVRAPSDKLHALLDEAQQATAADAAAKVSHVAAPQPVRQRARQLLNIGSQEATEDTPAEASAELSAPRASTPSLSPPLRFVLHVACLGGRWLVLQTSEPGQVERRLLHAMLQTAGIGLPSPPEFDVFQWPQLELEGMSQGASLEEAQEGLQAFVAGCARRGWAPTRLLWLGADETSPVAPVMAEEEAHSRTLGLPISHLPALAELSRNAELKRSSWPQLQALATLWREGEERQAT
ncbi:hypothetical protein R5M92_10170 [Halomonas sp. Bachu 37]|uniref:hypothetical protein n=1 Tax=Halomonas kashgarensis TaxID=3084920 RepID=UPI0032172693